jgi:hypothetical protein
MIFFPSSVHLAKQKLYRFKKQYEGYIKNIETAGNKVSMDALYYEIREKALAA